MHDLPEPVYLALLDARDDLERARHELHAHIEGQLESWQDTEDGAVCLTWLDILEGLVAAFRDED